MSDKKKKYYVIWIGLERGVFDSWNACKKYVEGYKGAKYKSFESKELAEEAYSRSYTEYINTETANSDAGKASKAQPKAWIDRDLDEKGDWPELNSWSVDAACSGNPGKMEYRGVYTATGQEIFKAGPFEQGTNNVGEFLAIVHGLALLKQKGESNINLIYSDSVNGMSWVRQGKCKTKLAQTAKNAQLFDLIRRAERWLENNHYTTEVRKWKTEEWGEIPADFGRK